MYAPINHNRAAAPCCRIIIYKSSTRKHSKSWITRVWLDPILLYAQCTKRHSTLTPDHTGSAHEESIAGIYRRATSSVVHTTQWERHIQANAARATKQVNNLPTAHRRCTKVYRHKAPNVEPCHYQWINNGSTEPLAFLIVLRFIWFSLCILTE